MASVQGELGLNLDQLISCIDMLGVISARVQLLEYLQTCSRQWERVDCL